MNRVWNRVWNGVCSLGESLGQAIYQPDPASAPEPEPEPEPNLLAQPHPPTAQQGLIIIDGKIVFNKNFTITSQKGKELYVDSNCRMYTKCMVPAKRKNDDNPKFKMRYTCTGLNCTHQMSRHINDNGEEEAIFRPGSIDHCITCNRSDHEVFI